jgi:hypothetical protein
MPRRIVTLTTDFGLTDHFAGTMKGVVLSLAGNVQLVDLTHAVDAFQIAGAAFDIAAAYRYFPKKTVHVVVVDPGVGTARRPILVEAAGQFFVAPDNGVLSMIFAREKHKVRAITERKFFRDPVSETFHGRDVFAPVAGHLALGVPAARFGKIVTDYCRLDFFQPVRTGERTWRGAVLKADRFGNLITNFHIAEFPAIRTRAFSLRCGMAEITKLARTFADGKAGEACLIAGSSGYLEIVINRNSAAERLACGACAAVELTID